MSDPAEYEALPRLCREVRRVLHELGPDGHAIDPAGASGWSGRVVRSHLKRCADCRTELAREQEVARGLATVRTAADTAPPADLLDTLLAQAQVHRRGLRGRAAVPARGAISGAKPHLSVALIAAGTVAGTGIGWAAWQGARAARRRLGKGVGGGAA